MTGTAGRPADALWARLGTLEEAVAGAVARRSSRSPGGGQGMFISEADVEWLLDRGRPEAAGRSPTALLSAGAHPAASGPSDRCALLASRFGLEPVDLAVLLVAAAVEVDERFGVLYAYLNDDVSRRRATVGLSLELCGVEVTFPGARARFRADAPLRRHGLLVLDDETQPFLGRTLRVPERVVDHLLGGDLPDEAVAPFLLPPLVVPSPEAGAVGAALERGIGVVYLRTSGGAVDHARAAGALASYGLPVVLADLAGLANRSDAVATAAAVAREAALAGAGLVVGPIDDLAAQCPAAIESLAAAVVPVVLLGFRAWEPAWTPTVPLILDCAGPDPAEVAAVWEAVLGHGDGDGDGDHAEDAGGDAAGDHDGDGDHAEDAGGDAAGATGEPAGRDVASPDATPGDGKEAARNGERSRELAAATANFRLAPHQVLRAAVAAQAYAAAAGGALDVEAVLAGARAQNGGRLEVLARRVRPQATVADLILPEPAAGQVLEVATRARLRHRVVGEWQMKGMGAKGTGITALFAGPSGTGKTLAAEVIAGLLGLDLYVVELSSVVDKYVGETEKNLERVFAGAAGINGVLFFDEADALFGKRSAVTDGHDRYANIEVAYLLQRMEQFDGVSLLATNLVANLDDAFARRIDVRVVFPLPEAPERRLLWARHLPPSLPLQDGVDLDLLARSFRVAGGDIRNITVAAAYDAAGRDERVGMVHLMRATAREYRKLGRLCTEEDFGPYLELVQA